MIQGGFDSGNYWIYSSASPVGDILSRLGVRFASATASVGEGDTRSVSYERADLLKDATPDFLPGSYSDAMGVVDSVENALWGRAG
ncbi:hypothetical protein [Streptomyces sp. CL12]|uniref:hypothetical protein n=1 Tax=Streptomyces sp. CL12 TaxID=3391744 RepID=UPI003A80D7E4